MSDNSRKTWKDVWERLTKVETKLDIVLGNVVQIPRMCEEIDVLQKAADKNSTEHKTFWQTFVSSKAFFSWLGALSTIIAIVTVLLFLR